MVRIIINYGQLSSDDLKYIEELYYRMWQHVPFFPLELRKSRDLSPFYPLFLLFWEFSVRLLLLLMHIRQHKITEKLLGSKSESYPLLTPYNSIQNQ